MAAVTPCDAQALALAAKQLPQWSVSSQALTCRWTFASFSEAMAFMQAAIDPIERANHHPEWTNCYDSVAVTLTTHDAGHRVTVRDIALAKELDHLAASFLTR